MNDDVLILKIDAMLRAGKSRPEISRELQIVRTDLDKYLRYRRKPIKSDRAARLENREILNAEIKNKQEAIREARRLRRIEQAEVDRKKYGKYDPRTDVFKILKKKYTTKKQQAGKKQFTVEFGDIEWPSHCPVLGMELDYYANGNKQENSPSFDCVDSALGYIKGNVKIISWRANRIKNNGNALEHKKIAEYIDNCSGSVGNGVLAQDV